MNGAPDWNQLLFYASVVSLALSLGNMAYTWISSRDRVTDKKFKELETDFHKQELEYTRLKGVVDALPTQLQMSRISNQVSELDGDMKAANAKLEGIKEQMEGFSSIAGRIEQFLLNQAADAAKGKRK